MIERRPARKQVDEGFMQIIRHRTLNSKKGDSQLVIAITVKGYIDITCPPRPQFFSTLNRRLAPRTIPHVTPKRKDLSWHGALQSQASIDRDLSRYRELEASPAANMSDAQANEAEKNIEIWKVKKLIKRLEAARGNGTSMISLIIREYIVAMRLGCYRSDNLCSAKGPGFPSGKDVGRRICTICPPFFVCHRLLNDL